MPRPDAGTADEWLARGWSALALASVAPDRKIYIEDLCFQAQQAAEKALKAVCRSRNIRFGYTHDLAELMDLLDEHQVVIPEPVDAAVILTRYAVQTRYPGLYPPLTEEDWKEAITLAEQTLKWAASVMA